MELLHGTVGAGLIATLSAPQFGGLAAHVFGVGGGFLQHFLTQEFVVEVPTAFRSSQFPSKLPVVSPTLVPPAVEVSISHIHLGPSAP
jgi:hypothetical protein